MLKLIGTDVTGSNMTFLIGSLLGILKEIVKRHTKKKPSRKRTLLLTKKAEYISIFIEGDVCLLYEHYFCFMLSAVKLCYNYTKH